MTTRRAVPDDDPHWSEFWRLYPRKKSKGDARAAWSKAVAKVDSPAVLIRAAERFAAWVDGERTRRPNTDKYVPYPATWLNREQWLDEPDREPVPAGGAYAHTGAPSRVLSADEWEQEGRNG